MCLLGAANEDVKNLNLDKILTYIGKLRDHTNSFLDKTIKTSLSEEN
jgi:hypothetical protein